jgi:hypothetical protein
MAIVGLYDVGIGSKIMGTGLIVWLVYILLAIVFFLSGIIFIYLGLKGKNKQGWIAAIIGISFVCLTIFGILAMFGFLFGWG